MRLTRFLAVALFAITLVACGGGGGGSDSFTTEPGTTPLNESNPSSENGTYKITQLEFYYTNGDYFNSDVLDQFDSTIVINIPADTIQMEMEWHDDVYGDYYDVDIDSYSNPIPDPGTTYDAFYYQIAGDYNLTFFYENLCSDGICADTIMRIKKISDSTAPIVLGKPAPALLSSDGTDSAKSLPFLILPR